jgi:hypothetical protein
MRPRQILITGGPVHAYIDDVKIITNKFKGGLMADLATKFVKYSEQDMEPEEKVKIFYLCSKNAQQPWHDEHLGGDDSPYLKVIHHNGIDDYMKQVLEIAPIVDAVVLGAAVANLIPKEKINGKFPSHNYQPGDTIPIDFTIAPRIIDEVKKANPKVHLFGYKLLSGVDYYELVRAAYGVLLESKAVTVFANDAKDLMQKYAVTKERGVHPIHNDDVMQWILDRLDESYYSTKTAKTDKITKEMEETKEYLNKLLCSHKCNFFETEEGFMFGSGAVKMDDSGARFVTTARGKQEMADYAFVENVDHNSREVYCATSKKASLNAPLFHYIFTRYPSVNQILHFHHQREDLITLDYATPGTDMDSNRRESKGPSFNIKGHGCILSYNKTGELLK